jgi:hypothetical protein
MEENHNTEKMSIEVEVLLKQVGGGIRHLRKK